MDLEIATADVREAFQSYGDGMDFRRVFYERGAIFDEWLRQIRVAAAVEALQKAYHGLAEDEGVEELSYIDWLIGEIKEGRA